MLIDSHCHLDFEVLERQLASVIQRAEAAGVGHFVVPAVTSERFDYLRQLAAAWPQISIAFGLHPYFIGAHTEQCLSLLETQLQSGGCCAVGEIGLDLQLANPQFEQQQWLFREQLCLAQSYRLPVIVHVRKAHDLVLLQLKRCGFTQGGIIHAFNGSQQQAARYVNEFGFKLGFGGAISYSRAKKLRRLAAELPLEWLVLETDSPDMPLVDFPDRPNEPARIANVLDYLVELRLESRQQLSEQLAGNTRQVLRL